MNISSFMILCLLVTLSILFRRHAISNTLSLCFCFSLSVHVSALYSRVLNTSTSYMYMGVFVALLSSLEFHTFPSTCHCQVTCTLANPNLVVLRLVVPLSSPT